MSSFDDNFWINYSFKSKISLLWTQGILALSQNINREKKIEKKKEKEREREREREIEKELEREDERGIDINIMMKKLQAYKKTYVHQMSLASIIVPGLKQHNHEPRIFHHDLTIALERERERKKFSLCFILFNRISTFMGYLKQKQSLYKYSSGTI